jgi:hypothetical protein
MYIITTCDPARYVSLAYHYTIKPDSLSPAYSTLILGLNPLYNKDQMILQKCGKCVCGLDSSVCLEVLIAVSMKMAVFWVVAL